MDRRKFVREVSLWSAGLAAAPVFKVSREALAAETAPAVLGVATGEDWPGLVARSLAPLGGMKALVKKGAKVVIKPNLSFDRTPEQGSNTHPDVLRAVIEEILALDPKEVIVFDRVLAEERRCYEQSGADDMMAKLGDNRVKLVHPEERDFVPVKLDRGIFFRTWQFYKKALEADAYINVPVAKHHGSAKLSLGLKNILGTLGGNRGKVHTRLDQGIADLNTVIRPSVTILDATRILLRNGPSGGNLEDVEIKNTVISSADTVAVDAYAAKTLFGMDPSELGYLSAAKALGLGEMDLSKIKAVEA